MPSDSSETGWGGTQAPGDWKYEAIDKNPHHKDACLILHWAEIKMNPSDKRDFAFSYGLGQVTKDPGGK